LPQEAQGELHQLETEPQAGQQVFHLQITKVAPKPFTPMVAVVE
jgi:hypothetical protein